MGWTEFRKRFILFLPKEERQKRYREFRLSMQLIWRQFRQDFPGNGI